MNSSVVLVEHGLAEAFAVRSGSDVKGFITTAHLNVRNLLSDVFGGYDEEDMRWPEGRRSEVLGVAMYRIAIAKLISLGETGAASAAILAGPSWRDLGMSMGAHSVEAFENEPINDRFTGLGQAYASINYRTALTFPVAHEVAHSALHDEVDDRGFFDDFMRTGLGASPGEASTEVESWLSQWWAEQSLEGRELLIRECGADSFALDAVSKAIAAGIGSGESELQGLGHEAGHAAVVDAVALSLLTASLTRAGESLAGVVKDIAHHEEKFDSNRIIADALAPTIIRLEHVFHSTHNQGHADWQHTIGSLSGEALGEITEVAFELMGFFLVRGAIFPGVASRSYEFLEQIDVTCNRVGESPGLLSDMRQWLPSLIESCLPNDVMGRHMLEAYLDCMNLLAQRPAPGIVEEASRSVRERAFLRGGIHRDGKRVYLPALVASERLHRNAESGENG